MRFKNMEHMVFKDLFVFQNLPLIYTKQEVTRFKRGWHESYLNH